MPFKSAAQARFMWAKHPDVAAEFQSKTVGPLPEKVKK